MDFFFLYIFFFAFQPSFSHVCRLPMFELKSGMTSSWVKGGGGGGTIIAMETHLPLFLYDLIQHAFKNMKAILKTSIHAQQTNIFLEGKLPHQWTSLQTT